MKDISCACTLFIKVLWFPFYIAEGGIKGIIVWYTTQAMNLGVINILLSIPFYSLTGALPIVRSRKFRVYIHNSIIAPDGLQCCVMAYIHKKGATTTADMARLKKQHDKFYYCKLWCCGVKNCRGRRVLPNILRQNMVFSLPYITPLSACTILFFCRKSSKAFCFYLSTELSAI